MNDGFASPRKGVVQFRCSQLTPPGPITSFGTADGHYSRVCWLPVLGPTAWVLWGTVAPDLTPEHLSVHDIDELTAALGLGRPDRLVKALKRLDRFGIAAGPNNPHDDCSWSIPAMCPPLRREHLRVLSETARRFHHDWTDKVDAGERHDQSQVIASTDVDHLGGHRSEGNPS